MARTKKAASSRGKARKKVGFRFSSTVQPKRYGGAVNRKGSKNLQAKLTEAKVKQARQLYAKAGFDECPPFEGYTLDPNSVYMTRTLA